MSGLFDVKTRQLRFGAIVVDLSDAEAAAVEYLWDRRGEVVHRTALERDVWGLAAGVRSETVPVTIRNIRAKLPTASKGMLQTVRGVGWKLLAPPNMATLPSFGAPMFARPDETSKIEALFAQGWRVVTVSGPAGAGKTRLTVDFATDLTNTVCFVDLEAVSEADSLERAVLVAAGLAGDDVSTLEGSFAGEPIVIVLDGCERLLTSVGALMDRLPSSRFLITSRMALDRADEAVHVVRPLSEQEWARFAIARLAASRWGHSTDASTLEALRQQMDGLPLAVEAIAGHPTPPSAVLEQLRRGDTGSVRTSALWQTLRSSYDALDPPAQHLLRQLAVVEGPLSDALIEDWLGAGTSARVLDLASQSLVVQLNRGWRMLRTLRSLVRELDPDPETTRDGFDQWLWTRCQRAELGLFKNPHTEAKALSSLTDDLLLCLRRGPVEAIPIVLWVLTFVAQLVGPLELYRAPLKLARSRLREGPLVRTLSALQGIPGTEADFLDAYAACTPEDQLRTLTSTMCRWHPTNIELPNTLPKGTPATPLHAIQQASLMLAQQPDLERATFELLERAEGFELLKLMIRVQSARIMARRNQRAEALATWHELVESSSIGAYGLKLFIQIGRVDALFEIDHERARTELGSIMIEATQNGFGTGWITGRSGMLMLLLGDPELALDYLEQARGGRHASTRRAAALLEAGVRRRLDLPAGPRPTEFKIDGVLNDGTPLKWLVEAIVHSEYDLADEETAPVQARIEAAPDTLFGRTWARSIKLRLDQSR